MDLGIKGRKAIVCGASRGLGYACARALAEDGVSVVLAARSAEPLQAAAEKISSETGVDVYPVASDVTTEDGRLKLIDACASPDIVVNNAGGPPPGDFRQWGREEWIAALDANMLSAIDLTRRVVDGMIERKFGRILNITSHMVKEPMGILGLSNGARAGLTGFMGGLARDLAPHNVTVNNILPGQFDTDRLRSNHEKFAGTLGRTPEEMRSGAQQQIPAGRFGDPEEFGAVCAFLSSAKAGFITGQNLLLDGGQYKGLL
jgi:3-oxoacyl-[acyl-carrier protein] reductase